LSWQEEFEGRWRAENELGVENFVGEGQTIDVARKTERMVCKEGVEQRLDFDLSHD